MSLTSLLSSDGYISVNKKLIIGLGLEHAVIIGELCSEYEYYKSRNMLTDDDFFFSTMKNIEDKTTIKEKRQRAVINDLEEKGLITTSKRGLPSKRYIRINAQNILNLLGSLSGPSSVKKAELDSSLEATNKNIYNNNIINNKDIKTLPQQVEGPSNNQLEEQFDQWYSFYPKKVNKKKAFDKFKLKVKKHGFEKVFEGMTSYAKVMELNGTDKQYIKGPDVFLNGEHYLDDQSELLKQKTVNQQQTYKPWEELAYGTETNSSNYDDYSKQLPNTTKQIGW